jgi:hypothetical protein
MSSGRRTLEQQAAYTRAATILRKNLIEWDIIMRTPARGEDWPRMLGRLNAALHQTVTLNNAIDDVMDHFVYVPKKATANPQDTPFFLSTRLEADDPMVDDAAAKDDDGAAFAAVTDPIQHLAVFESNAAKLANEFEKSKLRFV